MNSKEFLCVFFAGESATGASWALWSGEYLAAGLAFILIAAFSSLAAFVGDD
jgi:hypothetical protein